MNQLLQHLIIALKFIVPAFILRFPFTGVWGNYFLDIVDGDVLRLLGMEEFTYQTVDKGADLISYIFMAAAGARWRIRRIVLWLFAYRVVGQLLFFLTRDELMFFYFQNFLEPLLLIYTLLMFVKKSESAAYAVYRRHIKLIWAIVIGYKVWNEWYLHYANIDLSLLFFGFTG